MADVVRRLTVVANGEGFEPTTDKMKKLGVATNEVATVTDIATRRSLSAEEAYNRQTRALDPLAKAQDLIAKATRTATAALEQGIITQDQFAQRVEDITAKYTANADAAKDVGDGFHITGEQAVGAANNIRKAAEAAYLLSPAFRAVVNPAIAAGVGAIGTAFGAASPMIFSVATRLISVLSPLAKIYAAVKIVEFAWSSATEQIASYNKMSADASSLGTTTDYFQRVTKAAEDSGVKVDSLTASMKKLNDVTEDKLGGSVLALKVKELTDAGNFKGNTGVAKLENADTTKQAWEAIVSLVEQARDKSEMLAALDLTKTFLSPELQAALVKNNELLHDMNDKAVKMSETRLASQADVDIASSLTQRMDSATKILSERWIPFQQVLTDLGVKFHMVWVSLVETIAEGANGLNKFFNAMGRAFSIAGTNIATDFKKVAGIGQDYGSEYYDPKDTSVAKQTLRTALANPANVALAKDQTTDLSALLHPDKSKAIISKKTVDDSRDAIDRAEESLTKYIKVTEAAALTVGAGAYEVEKLRAMAVLEAAAEKEGIPLTSERAKGFQELANRAGAAAEALAKAKVANDIKFGMATALLSPEDVQIATQLKHIYPDVATALSSVEASGIRTKTALSGLSSTLSGQLTTGLTDILDGTKSVGQGFADMGKMVIRAIEEMIVKLLIVGPLMRALQGAMSGGAFSFLGIGGGSPEATAFASGITPMATGGVFSSSGIHKFASGGIFDQATSFRFANGAGFSNGILGEAGPEAVMPLQRGKDGKLGIAGGGSGSVSAPVSIHIDATGADAAGLARVQQQLAALQRSLPATIVTTVRKAKTNRVL